MILNEEQNTRYKNFDKKEALTTIKKFNEVHKIVSNNKKLSSPL